LKALPDQASVWVFIIDYSLDRPCWVFAFSHESVITGVNVSAVNFFKGNDAGETVDYWARLFRGHVGQMDSTGSKIKGRDSGNQWSEKVMAIERR
jgi:hypothetical protein